MLNSVVLNCPLHLTCECTLLCITARQKSLLATDSGPLLPTTWSSRCSTDLHWLSRFSSSRSPHLEHATTARHLCLIVDCI